MGEIYQNANFVEGALEKGVLGREKTLTSFVHSENRLWSQTLGPEYWFFKSYSIPYQAFVQIRKNNSFGQMQPQWIHRLVKYYIFFKNQIKGSFLRQMQPHTSDHELLSRVLARFQPAWADIIEQIKMPITTQGGPVLHHLPAGIDLPLPQFPDLIDEANNNLILGSEIGALV